MEFLALRSFVHSLQHLRRYVQHYTHTKIRDTDEIISVYTSWTHHVAQTRARSDGEDSTTLHFVDYNFSDFLTFFFEDNLSVRHATAEFYALLSLSSGVTH
jgi:hypothetical protein